MRELPIACTLDASDGARRLTQWRRLGVRAKLGAQLTGRTLAVDYQPEALAELRDLVHAERRCCAFLDWSLEESPERVLLRIRSDEHGEPELGRLADLFGALRGT